MDTDFPRGQLRLLFIERFASSSRRRTSSSAAAPPPPPPPPHKPATRRKFQIPSSVLGIPSSVLGIPYSVFRIPYSVFRRLTKEKADEPGMFSTCFPPGWFQPSSSFFSRSKSVVLKHPAWKGKERRCLRFMKAVGHTRQRQCFTEPIETSRRCGAEAGQDG